MSNIAFISNDYKTDFFIEIAKSIKSDNNIFWFVFNKKYYKTLINLFGIDNVLYINKRNFKSMDISLDKDLKLNELIYQDHTLRYQQSWASKYLKSVYILSKKFLINKKINFVFGELSRAHECLINRICKNELKKLCYYFSPNPIRIPNGYFAFFTDENHYGLLDAKNKSFGNFSKSLTVEKPEYYEQAKEFIKNNYSLVGRFKKAIRFIFRIDYDEDDPSKFYNRFTEFKLRIKREINKELYKTIKFDKIEDIKQDYILFPLQRYPEASIDVFGRYKENQYQHILNLWRIKPDNSIILVKEHETAIGERSIRFYKGLRKFTGIYIVDHKIDSHTLIKNAIITATVTGTVALEAALLGKNSLVFANPFFTRLNTVFNVQLKHFENSKNWDDFIKKVKKEKQVKMSVTEYLDFIETCSFRGVISDPVSDPKCIEHKNIKLVSQGFSKIINQLK